jgi:hypothetical protein
MKIFSNFISEDDPIYDGLKALNKSITFFYDYIPQNIDQLNINPINILMLHEPDEFFGMHSWVLNNHNLFTCILTWNDELINKCDNAILFPYSCNHLELEYINSFQNLNKKFEISFLSGAKKLVEGHQLRQEIYKIGEQISIPKKWFYVLDDFNWYDFNKGGVGRPYSAAGQSEGKQICYKEPMFHVCVENVNYNNWYTEKISDAFLTKTIPLYWGCSNISDFGYDEKGIIRFGNPEELLYLINNLTEGKYNKMKPYVDHNYNIAKSELKLKDKLEMFFQNLIELNSL